MSSALVASAALGDVPRRLAELLGAREPPALEVVPVVPPAVAPARAAAVDGSSAVVADARAFVLGAYRAGVVSVAGGRVAARDVDATRVALLERGAAAAPVRRALAALGADGVRVEDAATSPEAALGHLRALAELAAARRALDGLGDGDVLLLDGPLRAREPDAPHGVVDALAREAASRGVALVGVAKGTSITVDGLPALAVASRAGRGSRRASWAVELPRPPGALARVYAARLSAAEHRLFRVDVSARDPDPVSTLGRVAALCGHPAYPGYPSPLAMAHQAVVLADGEQREVRQAVRRAAEDAGADAALWDLAFGDYHDVLDLGA